MKSVAENKAHVEGERLTREKEPLVSCTRCTGWATETHARANDGLCSYCMELRRALKSQQERVGNQREAGAGGGGACGRWGETWGGVGGRHGLTDEL